MSHFGDWVASSITNLCIQLTHSKIQDWTLSCHYGVNWVAVKELNSRYFIGEKLLLTIKNHRGNHRGNLI